MILIANFSSMKVQNFYFMKGDLVAKTEIENEMKKSMKRINVMSFDDQPTLSTLASSFRVFR